jgi:hypothetical protein
MKYCTRIKREPMTMIGKAAKTVGEFWVNFFPLAQ